MMQKTIEILLVEDNPGDAFLVEEYLSEIQDFEFNMLIIGTLQETMHVLIQKVFDIILLDLGLPDSNHLQALERVLEAAPDIPVVVITGLNDEQTGRHSVKLGAQGYLVKNELSSRIIYQSILYSVERFEHLKKIKSRELEMQEKNRLLSEANAAKNLMFSVISHDLRSPIHSIIALLDILNSEFDELSDRSKKKYIESILASAVNTQDLMENLLQWAQTQSNHYKVKQEILFVDSLVDKVVSTTYMTAGKKEIEITCNIQSQLQVIADRAMTMTVLRNVLSNAVKFTPRKGRIIISAENSSPDEVIVAVEDTGIGINREYLGRIFDAGKALSTHGTEDEPGTGLGLSLCKELVEKNKGRLWIERTSSEGTVVCFSLPRHNPPCSIEY